MNKIFYPLLVMTLIAGCSSAPKSQVEENNQAVVNHMAKGKQPIGKDFDEKFTKEGILNGEYVAIGMYTGYENESMMKLKAEEDSKTRLLNSAPTEFKKVIQNAISTATGTNNVEKVTITIAEVHALTGLNSNLSDSQCVKYSIPTEDLKYKYETECRVITRVPSSNLMKAYSYTMDKKYSIKEESAIKDILKEQLAQKLLEGTNSSKR